METIQIDYDPTQTSYEQLLDAFWDSHNPTKRSWSRQYMSAIFYHNEEQKRLASQTRDREAAKTGKRIYTEIIPFSEFTLAEVYHQKYRLQQDRLLMQEFSVIYPAAEDFVNSTAAARVNGYLGGYGSLAGLKAELSSLGLSAEGGKRLLEIVSPRGK